MPAGPDDSGVVCRDVTEPAQAAQYARSLIEAFPHPLATISPEGTITGVNHAAARLTGADRDDLIGTDYADCFSEPEQAREANRQVFANGSITDCPLTIRHKDGRLTVGRELKMIELKKEIAELKALAFGSAAE